MKQNTSPPAGRLSEDYPERVYAGWLGKIIGIRLGAPIESMTRQKIQDIFGSVHDYLIDYDLFAADDDSNGPLFLVRALADSGKGWDLEAQDVAEALLNYAPYEHGFFWWGGYGISTEHTAYLNLRRGIPAPQSGSIQTNGATAAEQIGGQIFSDCWGLVCPGHPAEAAALAEKASSVTHDGNAVYGGRFVAAAISLAFVETDIAVVIQKALAQIPEDCEYRRAADHVIAFHQAHPEDWSACFREIQENFGYDRYPGACHIIPNAAVMILSMLYGQGSFEKTLTICCMCGWDTDCNAGNTGAILGVLQGMQGIDWGKWRKPVNDFLACSSVLGYLNLTDIPTGASYMAACGYRLLQEEIPERWLPALARPEDCLFAYPGSTQAMRVRVHRDLRFPYRTHSYLGSTTEAYRTCGRSLKLYCCRVTDGQAVDLYKRTYLYPEDFQDSRYDPAFSPTLYPGERIRGWVRVPEYARSCRAAAYVGYRGGQSVTGEIRLCTPGKWVELRLDIPAGSELIEEAGLRFYVTGPDTDKAELCVLIDAFVTEGTPDYTVRLANESAVYWKPTHQDITQFTQLKGTARLENGTMLLSSSDFEEVYTGKTTWEDYTVSARIVPVAGGEHFLLFRVQGAIRSYGFGFSGEEHAILMKNNNGYAVLSDCAYHWQYGAVYQLSVIVRGNTISCAVNGKVCIEYTDLTRPYRSGAVGAAVRDHSACRIEQISIRGDALFKDR